MAASAPAITGEFMIGGTESTYAYGVGAFYASGTGGNFSTGHASGATNPHYYFNASRSSSIYGASSTVRPVSKQTLLMIRY